MHENPFNIIINAYYELFAPDQDLHLKLLISEKSGICRTCKKLKRGYPDLSVSQMILPEDLIKLGSLRIIGWRGRRRTGLGPPGGEIIRCIVGSFLT